MAWRCHAANNAGLVEALTANGLITHPRVRQAMLSVERGHFAASKQDSARAALLLEPAWRPLAIILGSRNRCSLDVTTTNVRAGDVRAGLHGPPTRDWIRRHHERAPHARALLGSAGAAPPRRNERAGRRQRHWVPHRLHGSHGEPHLSVHSGGTG
eukprot:3550550-Pyramimonas_sp.AAC.1